MSDAPVERIKEYVPSSDSRKRPFKAKSSKLLRGSSDRLQVFLPSCLRLLPSSRPMSTHRATARIFGRPTLLLPRAKHSSLLRPSPLSRAGRSGLSLPRRLGSRSSILLRMVRRCRHHYKRRQLLRLKLLPYLRCLDPCKPCLPPRLAQSFRPTTKRRPTSLVRNILLGSTPRPALR